MVDFDAVTCRYGSEQPIFSRQSFHIGRERTTMILGPNGSGKTTLIKCLTKQLSPTSGCIEVAGRPLRDLSHRELAKLISYVPQTIDPEIDYSVADFVAFGRTPYLGMFESPRPRDYDIARACAEQTGIEYVWSKPMNELSGGERQLAYVARALAQQTPIVLMDEPMSALDYSNQARMLQTIATLTQNHKTVILSSHNPNHAVAIDADVLLIDHNGVITQGAARELLAKDAVLKTTFGENVRCIRHGEDLFVSFDLQQRSS